jgi:hypothetical protein
LKDKERIKMNITKEEAEMLYWMLQAKWADYGIDEKEHALLSRIADYIGEEPIVDLE